MKIGFVVLAGLLAVFCTQKAYAVDQAVVVSDCATVTGLSAGQISGIFMDTTGHLCTNATTSSNVTIAGPLGTQNIAGSVAVTQSNGADVVEGITTATHGCASPYTVNGCLGQLDDDIKGSIAAGSALIGKVGIDQTTPGTTNNVTISTNVGTLPLLQATASASVSTASAATLQVVAASGSTVIRVMNWVLVTTLANNVTWESGDTGGSCANPVALSGAMPFAANGGASVGSGLGPVLILPSGKALCMLTSAATQISGSVSYAQF